MKSGKNNKLMNFDYSNRHFKTHDLRKSRFLKFYALGYAKNTIADFATHSSEATTFSFIPVTMAFRQRMKKDL